MACGYDVDKLKFKDIDNPSESSQLIRFTAERSEGKLSAETPNTASTLPGIFLGLQVHHKQRPYAALVNTAFIHACTILLQVCASRPAQPVTPSS